MARVKTCPNCYLVNEEWAHTCMDCGFNLPTQAIDRNDLKPGMREELKVEATVGAPPRKVSRRTAFGDRSVESDTPITPVEALDPESRGRFIGRVYAHLAGAIAAFVLIEVFLFANGIADDLAQWMLSFSWLFVLGAFVLLAYGGSHLAHRSTSPNVQYAGLGLMVVAEAIIFVPLLWIANEFAPGAIQSAAIVSALAFGALTVVVFKTGKDFSFLRTLLIWGGILAWALIMGAVIFGFGLGLFFAVAMVGFAGAAILYDTSNIIHYFPEDRYVAASLELFSSVMLLFWYVLSIFISRD